MMKKLENEVLLSRRAALGAFAAVALGDCRSSCRLWKR